jgi:hypothetical protein
VGRPFFFGSVGAAGGGGIGFNQLAALGAERTVLLGDQHPVTRNFNLRMPRARRARRTVRASLELRNLQKEFLGNAPL